MRIYKVKALAIVFLVAVAAVLFSFLAFLKNNTDQDGVSSFIERPAFTYISSPTQSSAGDDKQKPDESKNSQTEKEESREDKSSHSESKNNQDESKNNQNKEQEFRGVWISYINLSNWIKGLDYSDFKNKINYMFDTVKEMGMNAVIVHVRPFADAIYPSKLFPWSHILTGTQGVDPGYDPLDYMVKAAHERELEIHAWLNPLRVSFSSINVDAANPQSLSADNKVRQWMTGKDASKHDWARSVVAPGKNGIYLNPAIDEVRKLIVDGVKEIVQNYDVDGVCIDDYFYPTTENTFDSEAYGRYLKSVQGVPLTLEQWRINNINLLVSQIYSSIKEINKDVVFGISPQANINNNYNSQFADVRRWGSVAGYCDYLCPQIYFTDMHKTLPFDKAAMQWSDLVTNLNVKLYIAIASYRIGEVNALDSWISDTHDILQKQIEYGRSLPKCSGFTFFDFDSFIKFKDSKEIQNLKAAMAIQ